MLIRKIKGAPKYISYIRFLNSFIPGKLYRRTASRTGFDFYGKTINGLLENNLDVVPEDWPRISRFLTRSKTLIIKEIGYEVKVLAENAFLGKSGNSSRLIYGEKGIGKSSSLTLSVMGVWLHFYNVLPIYVEYVGNTVDYKSPSELICHHLNIDEKTPLSECLKLLSVREEYVLFIADEVEQIYSNIDLPHKRKKILDEFAELGSQTTGRCYTLLCGSSPHLPALISKSAVHDEEIRKEFPMVELAPDLNWSKFPSIRVHRCYDFQNDFEVIKNHYGFSEAFCNQLFFLAGSNLRTIDYVITTLQSEHLDADSIASRILDHCYPPKLLDIRGKKSTHEYREFIDFVTSAIIRKNHTIISQVYHDPKQVSFISWTKELKPLGYGEIRELCTKFRIFGNEMSTLVDEGYFLAPPSVGHLHMARPLDLLMHYPRYLSERPLQRFWDFVSLKSSKTVKDVAAAAVREALIGVVK